MLFRRFVGLGYGYYWRGIIFDSEYKNLDDLISKTKRWFSAFDDGAKFLSASKDMRWVWPTGEELLFRAIDSEEDYWKFHGQEFPYIGWNELTKFPSGNLYHNMMSINRSSFVPELHTPKRHDKNGRLVGYDTPDNNPLPPIPLRVFSTTNPKGAGHIWVKRKFIDVADYGEIVTHEREIYNPRSQQREKVELTQTAIFGSFVENPFLPPEYIAGLMDIEDEATFRAWVLGDWDIVSGGAFDDVWRRNVHVIPRFPIPESWYVDRSFDWGSTHPFSVGWWAEANGEEVQLPDGRVFCPAKGSLIRISEIYGAKEIGNNVGLKWSSVDLAVAIRRHEEDLIEQGWIARKPWPGPADNEIRNVRDMATETIEKKMLDHGVAWEKSDKGPGTRKIGLELIRGRLQASLKNEEPGLYFMRNNTAAITILPILPRDDKKPDDVDTKAEDHVYDEIRYRVLKSNNRTATKFNLGFAST
mgnify:CR=1 FL=1